MVVVPAGAIAERRVVNRLMQANAISPETAAALDGLRRIQARRLARLIDAGVVREHQPGRYYLDVPAYADRMTTRRQRAAILMLVIIAVILIGSCLGSLRNRPI